MLNDDHVVMVMVMMMTVMRHRGRRNQAERGNGGQ
jgi:hypothetical protein